MVELLLLQAGHQRGRVSRIPLHHHRLAWYGISRHAEDRDRPAVAPRGSGYSCFGAYYGYAQMRAEQCCRICVVVFSPWFSQMSFRFHVLLTELSHFSFRLKKDG